ncbi:MAG: hypothetical protein G3M78_14550 [Candidatus Nitrohelix vancouverensis]|uniref:Cytochrome c-type biogenesis protein n=1 Tax=Candidatus Nitrohelix vancouverensis TaxID=2705534 RepID=A0A7T0C4V0_9BACT|nr:MAG: hypothetical protein G3M78_14550 [Candidatus Nitrohelix vancouverensis]
MKMKGLILSLALALVLAMSSGVQASALLADLENALMCECDDKCGKVLGNCTCDTSDKIRADYTKRLESGLTVEQIIQQEVDKYGETILSAPTKSGFNITAWLTPFVALVAGGVGVRKVIQLWTGKKQKSDQPEGAGTAEPTADSAKYSRRLQDELDKLE